MGEIIQINFKNQKQAFTLELYRENFSFTCEPVFTNNLIEAKLTAVLRAKAIEKIRALMIYRGLPEEKKMSDRPLIVMLKKDILSFDISDQIEECR